MLLMFPSGLPMKEDELIIRSLNKEDFDMRVEEKVSAGWEVQTLSSNFRKTLFGGVSFYKAELRRGITNPEK